MTDTHIMINPDLDDLKRRIESALPEPDEDGVFGDGSDEQYALLFEKAYDKVLKVAEEAIRMLETERSESI